MHVRETSKLLNEHLGQRSVLLLEPSVGYRNSIKLFLHNLRVKNVKAVNNPEEAERIILGLDVGLFIVEWSEDRESGLAFCRKIMGINDHNQIPFLLITSEASRTDVMLAAEIGIHFYLAKPFSYEDFVKKIYTVMKRTLQPSELTSILNRAYHNLEQGFFQEAEELFAKSLDLEPKSARALCGLARIDMEKNAYDAAIEKIQQVLVENKHYIEGLKLLLMIYEKQKNYDFVEKQALLLHQLSPENGEYTMKLAQLALKNKDIAGAERYFKKSLQISPTLVEAYQGLGDIYTGKSDYDKALRFYGKAVELDKENISLWNALGLTYVNQEKFKEGIECYQKAYQLDPREVRILFNLGYAFEKQDQWDKALEFYQKALKVESNYHKAVTGLKRVESILAHKISS